ncbi:DNA mismatch repair protein MutS [bacterium]|nr:DNA mismatch repair protein MutS [bacterium]
MTKQEINHINSADVNIQDATPVMQQYLEIKRKNPDILLLYRLGDFYETFFEDAEIMAKELELTLTGRDAGPILGRVPLAGIPAKALNNYVGKLIEKGYKAAVCEQLEDPKAAKGLVKRGIVRILTSGTITDSNLLEQNSNNYICAIFREKETYGFAYTDISTGEFKATQASLNLILSELARIKPSEVVAPGINQKLMPFQIVPEQIPDLPEEITQIYKCSLLPKSVFEENFAKTNLKAVFKTDSLDSMGYKDYPLAFRASAAVLGYIWENLKDSFPKFDRIETYELSEYMMIDANTRKNLELTETLREKNKYGSLLWAIDKTQTNMGARLLKSWICQPLKNISEIQNRQNVVEELFNNNEIRLSLTEVLKNIYDIQRLATRLSNGTASPRDFLSLKLSLFNLPELFNLTSQMDNNLFEKAEEYREELAEFADIIERTIEEDAPVQIKEGGLIKAGVNNDLDYLKDLMNNGEKWLKQFEETEKEKTGIKNLKVGYNRVFGYYIEVTNSNLSQIPSNYIRKQTLTGGERFITDELKKYENDVLSAQTKAYELEYKLFCDLRNYSKEYVEQIREVAQRIAELDVLLSFATNALENNYTKPEIDESTDFVIRNGRHAVLEKILPLGTYVSNDLELSGNNKNYTQFMILTGPNMAGKSTYMRQNALILILAQIGSFIPADYGKIGIADKLFTRVGASDDLTLGQSTFMVEMIEAAYILNTATDRSFILIDEIGRGTSTYDGVAIAWSVAEHIATKIGARCIFATHYHELNVMTNTYPQIKNYRITVSEENGKIEFLRKIVPGGASKSYGIHVAQMAGLPDSVVNRSKDLMKKMQRDFSKNLATKKQVSEEELVPQLNLF